jgi:CHAD domain-containing protein
MRAAVEDPRPDEVHRWRRRAKEHLHHLELLRPAWRRALGAERRAASALVETLGESRDAGLLADQLEMLAVDLPGVELEALVAELRHERERLLATAFRLGPLVYTEKPRAHVRRIHGYWRAWRRSPLAGAAESDVLG